MRSEISYNNVSRPQSWGDGTLWFNNMTIYIDTLRDIQRKMAVDILYRLNQAVTTDNADLAVSIGIMVIVVFMCVIIIKAVESLTANMQVSILMFLPFFFAPLTPGTSLNTERKITLRKERIDHLCISHNEP